MSESQRPDNLNQYFQAAVSVDNVVFGFDNEVLKILLIYRGAEPYKNYWALPGDLINLESDLDNSAVNVLQSLTGLDDIFMEQIRTFGRVDRHPFGRVYTVAYYSLIKSEDYKVSAQSWAEEADWFPISKLPELPFDHNEIVEFAKQQLKMRIRVQPVGFELLPKYFTLSELQKLYEAILETEFDVRNFRKKILSTGFILDTGLKQTGVTHRPAKLYKYNAKRDYSIISSGMNFDL